MEKIDIESPQINSLKQTEDESRLANLVNNKHNKNRDKKKYLVHSQNSQVKMNHPKLKT